MKKGLFKPATDSEVRSRRELDPLILSQRCVTRSDILAYFTLAGMEVVEIKENVMTHSVELYIYAKLKTSVEVQRILQNFMEISSFTIRWTFFVNKRRFTA